MLLNRQRLIIFFIPIYILTYYAILIFGNNETGIVIVFRNIFSLLAPLLAAIWLYCATSKKRNISKAFLLFLSAGCFSYFLAEIAWNYYEVILQTEIPFPGSPDVFYMLQIIFFLIGFIFLWFSEGKINRGIRFVFEILIIMTVATTLSYHFLIQKLILNPDINGIFLFVYIGYPIGGLLLLASVIITLYLSSNFIKMRKGLFIILLGILFQIVADSSYLYLLIAEKYATGSLIDPLFTVALLLIGASSFYFDEKSSKRNVNKKASKFKREFIEFALPYASIALLLFVLIRTGNANVSAINIGTFITIVIVFIRQLFVLIENKKLIKQYDFLAHHDSLTRLPNRAFFEEKLAHHIKEVQEENGMIGVLYLDLDRFKLVNDTLGHDAGDDLIYAVSKRLLQCVNAGDLVARQGGDEFTLLITSCRQESEVLSISNRIIEQVSIPYHIKGTEFRTTASIGIAFYTEKHAPSTPLSLMKKADIAMYEAKTRGKNQYQVYEEEMQDNSKNKFMLEKDLYKAIQNKEFTLFYQPQMNVKSEKIYGVEALIRWNHPEKGIIPPIEFIPIAENMNLIGLISEWVLREACSQCRKWQDIGLDIKVSVNISPKQFQSTNFVEMLKEIIEETKVDPALIELEITEAIAMYSNGETVKKLNEITDLGIHVSIDDFGTGYSSLAYLVRLPIHALKVPKEFVKDLNKDGANASVVFSIISLSKSLQLDIVAEGVETKEQLDILKRMGCKQFQGYYFSKPVTEVEVTKLLRENKPQS
ncbi:MAG: DUF4084 domain-containing protein [Bacillaceae bacterium]|nr:DUF4084 domain-containing protein [Bacillaceae bacterium]